jgi:hypothetical protein
VHAFVKHKASPDFWYHFRQLPPEIQELALKNFELLKSEPRHPSLRLKKIGDLWSARVGLRYRAIGWLMDDTMVWDWIGPHDAYERIIRR